MRLVLTALAVLAGAFPVAAEPVQEEHRLAQAVYDLSTGAGCLGVATGAIAMPRGGEPDAVERAIAAMQQMGLGFGASPSAMKGLGTPGISLVAQAVMGSRKIDDADLLLAVGGREPGCRVILMSEAAVDEGEAVASRLKLSGWKESPAAINQGAGGITRRMFVKRDAKGAPYLMNLITFAAPAPGSNVRLYTTTVAIPANVTLPPGF